jgi:WD40 repeat protein
MAECELTGMLAAIIHIDSIGLMEPDAERVLFDGLKPSGRPAQPPAFPGDRKIPIAAAAPFPPNLARLHGVPDLPPHYLPREEVLTGLKRKLLIGDASIAITGQGQAFGVQGMGGVGKTVLAAALARDLEVRQAFPDGIYWLTVGQKPSVLLLQSQLLQRLGVSGHAVNTVQDGKDALRDAFEGRRALLIIDDVWTVDDFDTLSVAASPARLLITTRNNEVLVGLGAEEHRVDVLWPSDALKMLAQWVGQKNPDKLALEKAPRPWLRPIRANLTPPGGPLIRTLEGHTTSVWAVAVTPDGLRAVSGSTDRTLRLWDLESGQTTRTLEGHANNVSAVAVTPDGLRAVSASADRTLRLWNLENGQTLRTLVGHTNWVTAVSITPHGHRAISVSNDATLRLCDLETGQTVHTLKGHTGSVSAVAVTPDSRRALSASQDQTVRLWELESGKEIATFTGESEMNRCAIAPDGQTIIVGDALGLVHFLRLVEADETKPALSDTKIPLLLELHLNRRPPRPFGRELFSAEITGEK